MVRLSYDIPFVFGEVALTNDVAVVVMDEAAHEALGQDYSEKSQKWDRRLHARLLRRLQADGCRTVVLDLLFRPLEEIPGEDGQLLSALSQTSSAFIAAIVEESNLPGVEGVQVILPREDYIEAVGEDHWGLASVRPDADMVVRRHDFETAQVPSLARIAAAAVGSRVPGLIDPGQPQRWIRYYGPFGSADSPFERLSYHVALDKGPGYFRDKIVFVGGYPRTGFPGDEVDEFRVPYTRWDGRSAAGVEILATIFLNLVREDWLTRWAPAREALALIFAGLFLGSTLVPLRPGWAVLAGLAASATVSVLGIWWVWSNQTWFTWVIIAGAQVPVAVLWSVVAYTRRVSVENRVLETEAVGGRAAGTPTVVMPPFPERPTESGLPFVPDYHLLSQVGDGAYGEVWLARDAVGVLRAVKVVYRARLPKPDIYEREFRGMSNYMPLSLNHPALLHVVHAGRNDAAGYYYCVMEAGDDEVSGAQINPASYRPKDLGKELGRRGRFPVHESAHLALQLASALEFLHNKGLIHRDIKPSNIIFVNGCPKLADIGLVSHFNSESKDQPSNVGTLVYMAPEGPKSPAADVYGLGKVIYEMCTGLDPRQFPEIPVDLLDQPDADAFNRLNRILLTCCDPDSRKRYPSGKELRETLEAFLSQR
jgi:CHASE2 domain-containing sensor protein